MDISELLFSDLVKEIEIKETSPCIADPQRIKVIAALKKELSKDVLKVIFLAIPNSSLSEDSVSFKIRQHLVTIFSDGFIGLTYLKDVEEAKLLLEEIRKMVNKALIYIKTKNMDEELVKQKKELNPMKVFEELPKTDCKECGEVSCFSFAVKILNGEKALEECKQLGKLSKANIEKMMRPITL